MKPYDHLALQLLDLTRRVNRIEDLMNERTAKKCICLLDMTDDAFPSEESTAINDEEAL